MMLTSALRTLTGFSLQRSIYPRTDSVRSYPVKGQKISPLRKRAGRSAKKAMLRTFRASPFCFYLRFVLNALTTPDERGMKLWLGATGRRLLLFFFFSRTD